MTNPFDSPGSFEGIDYASHLGSLLIIDVLGVEYGVKTQFGESDAVRANVAVADGAGVGTAYSDALIFPRGLVGQLKGKVGRKVLGRLGQGAPKAGQSPPWLLLDPTDQDTAIGIDFLNRQSLAAPAPAQPEPQAGYQQAPPAQGYPPQQGAPQGYPAQQQPAQGYGQPQGYPAGPVAGGPRV